MTGISYIDAVDDPDVFGPWFTGESWSTWRIIDKVLSGAALDAAELPVFRELTGLDAPPAEPVTELWVVAGRRGAKTLKAGSYGTHLATIGAEQHGYRQRLTRGERGVVQIIAMDRAQARVAFGYVRAFFEQPMLRAMVERETADSIELRNQLSIEVTTNDFRRVRGRTVVAAIFDEVAMWSDESGANPGEEVYAAIKPAMATMPGALLIGISSPHARKGLLWRKYQKHYGQSGPVLVVKAPTLRLNPTIDSAIIDEAYQDDPARASAEYGAEFRNDVETYVSREAVQAVVSAGVREREPLPGLTYIAFTDPAGGSGQDAFTLAIAHLDDGVAVLDAVREVRPPFSPEAVVAEFAETLKSYGISRVRGDRYAGEWPREQFKNCHITYEVSDKRKSEIYRDFLPAVNSGKTDLLDNTRMIAQLVSLERRTSRGGKDSIDHPPNGHDDVINSAAGVLVNLTGRRRYGMLDVL